LKPGGNKKAGSEFWFPAAVLPSCAVGELMRRVLQEVVLFSCLAAFVTGVVIAAASLIG
jgi:hypothetical protein